MSIRASSYKKLSKSDLLLAMVTAKWGDVNARDEIYAFVDRLNNDLVRKAEAAHEYSRGACRRPRTHICLT